MTGPPMPQTFEDTLTQAMITEIAGVSSMLCSKARLVGAQQMHIECQMNECSLMLCLQYHGHM